MRLRTVLTYFAFAMLFALGGTCSLYAQTAPPPVLTGGGTSCLPLTVSHPFAPTPQTGWRLQLTSQVDGGLVVNFGAADTASPWTRTVTLTPGAYTITGTWSRSGVTRTVPPARYVCGGAAPPPPPVNRDCAGAWQREGIILEHACEPTNTRQVVYRERFIITEQASGTGAACTVADQSTREVSGTVACTFVPPPPPTEKPIFGVVDATILGQCSAGVHDKHVVDVGLPVRFRTWHPQTDPTGCVYAHEHGFNPATMQNAEIAAEPVAFGVVGWSHKSPAEPNGHEEPHEGFKVFIANVGDVNDEGRRNRVWSRSVFHMGSGGPRRFTQQFHSAMIRLIHPEFGLKAFTQLMMDTGGSATVCDPRVQAPTKDVMQLNSPCLLNSGYEIWSTQQSVMAGGREVYRAFATPAVFDPITVRNPANPTELVYAWDPRMAASKRFTDDWSGNRGCDRESYAQPGYWYNGTGRTEYWTDAMGAEVAPGAPGALLQVISRSESVGSPATHDGLFQFKNRVGFCQQRSLLGLKN